MPDERLPYGKQISPNQINLRHALQLVRDIPNDKDAVYQAIGDANFPERDDRNRKTSGMNCFLAMRSYGLATEDDDYLLTDLGEQLLKTETDDAFNERLAQHILLNLHGMQVVEAVDSLEARGVKVTVETVVDELTALGIGSGGDSGEDLNPLRLWLERGGVFMSGKGKGKWTIDSAVVKRLTGASTSEIPEIVDLTRSQQAFLRALATYTDDGPATGATIRALAEVQTPGIKFDTKTFAGRVVKQLADLGWIDAEKTTGGRGAKSGRVAPTQKFVTTISKRLMDTVLEQTHLLDPVSLRKPLPELLAVVADERNNAHARGMALEGVCIQVLRMLGLRFLGWRLRSDKTAGAEVDLVAETIRAPHLLVQLQSKASAITGREWIDREVGVAQTLKSNVVLFVSAKTIGEAARRAAVAYMQESNIAILFLDGDDLKQSAAGVIKGFYREWGYVHRIKGKRGQERTRSMTD